MRSSSLGVFLVLVWACVDHLARRWDGPLAAVPPERFEDETYPTPWDVPYCIDSMLEHAVMHPIRHEFQLKELMGEPL